LQIAYAMDRVGENEDELWDEEDGFYYDLLILPDGRVERVRIRSMVGLLALAANAVFTPEVLERLPKLKKRMGWYHQNNPEFGETINNGQISGVEGRLLFSVNTEHKLKRILQRMLDPERFLSDYGIRALSRWHKDNPYVVVIGRQEYRVQYEPAESSSGLFGGNSNWRGPIWMPVNMLLVESLLKLYRYYGDDFKVECPVGSGQMLTLWEVSKEIGQRLSNIFLRDETWQRRAVYGDAEKFQNDEHWRDLILFYEYFHGDNGAGIGASHQTGWTGVIARIIQFFHQVPDGETFLKMDRNECNAPLGLDNLSG
jgi:hypothetical protein